MAELDKNGNVESVFIYGPNANVPSYMIKNGTKYQIVSNHLGSVRMVVNVQTGNVVQKMKYDAFGHVILDTNPGFQPFGFGGGLYDHQTGLVRFGARDYDPNVGRWTSKDPILFGGRSSNLYEYVFNHPVNFIDSTGRICAIGGIGGSYVTGGGGDANAGGFICDSGQKNVGTFGSAGGGIGRNVSSDIFAGLILGSSDDLEGETVNLNGAIPVLPLTEFGAPADIDLSVSVFFDPILKFPPDVRGFTIGLGPGEAGPGLSGTINRTSRLISTTFGTTSTTCPTQGETNSSSKIK